jgi:predicted alpha/beta superfamily hydrolase
MAQHTVNLEISSLPTDQASRTGIYAAGSFNNWNPKDEEYKFKKNGSGNYTLELKLARGKYEFKITRGSWNRVECNEDATSIDNRELNVTGDTTVRLKIAQWKDNFPEEPKQSTASKNVYVVDTVFYIPQLDRTRRVWIYLPPDYYRSRKKHYPVLYMHDGQNVFDEATSFSGEWGVDEYLDSIRQPACIVVAIDNSPTKRLNEYNPYNHKEYGKGEGRLYLDFLVKTLRPFINKNYRTLTQKKNTFVAGSSMGGLISFYAVLQYPRVFGAVGVFSPAFWVSGSSLYKDIKLMGARTNSRIYFYGGRQEGETMVSDIIKTFEAMGKVSKSKMVMIIREDGKHNEPTWRKEFPLFYKWAFE